MPRPLALTRYVSARDVMLALALTACAPPDDSEPDSIGGGPPAICPVPFAPTTEPPTGCDVDAECEGVAPPTCAAMYRCGDECVVVHDCACAVKLEECGAPLPPACGGV